MFAAVEQVEVAVVGAGLLGSATAWALGARGVPAVLLEQFAFGHDRGSSHGATRIFRYSHAEPDYVRMAVAARGAWDRLQSDAGEQLLVTTGGLDAGPGAEPCAAALAECGVPYQWLTAAQLAERFRGIAARPGERMLYQPDAGVCLAGKAVAALQRLARRRGVALREGAAVHGVERGGRGAVVHTAAGEIEARSVVVTAGPWTEYVLAGALARVPRLTPTLQQIRYFRPASPGDRWPVLIERPEADPGWYTVPAGGGAPGVKVAADVPQRAVDPREGPFPVIEPALEEQARAYVATRLPGLVPAGLAAETCLYTMTSDEDFLLGREGPIVVGGGCSGHGFKFGPLLGELLVGLAVGDEPGFPRERFALDRAALTVRPPG